MLKLKVNGLWLDYVEPLRDMEEWGAGAKQSNGKHTLRAESIWQSTAWPVPKRYYTTGKLPEEWNCIAPEYIVYSYDTPIAWLSRHFNYRGTWYMPNVKYSVTTSKHQGRILTALTKVAELDDRPLVTSL